MQRSRHATDVAGRRSGHQRAAEADQVLPTALLGLLLDLLSRLLFPAPNAGVAQAGGRFRRRAERQQRIPDQSAFCALVDLRAQPLRSSAHRSTDVEVQIEGLAPHLPGVAGPCFAAGVRWGIAAPAKMTPIALHLLLVHSAHITDGDDVEAMPLGHAPTAVGTTPRISGLQQLLDKFPCTLDNIHGGLDLLAV
nr:hypothetical protein [Chloroflexota bacterium]